MSCRFHYLATKDTVVNSASLTDQNNRVDLMYLICRTVAVITHIVGHHQYIYLKRTAQLSHNINITHTSTTQIANRKVYYLAVHTTTTNNYSSTGKATLQHRSTRSAVPTRGLARAKSKCVTRLAAS